MNWRVFLRAFGNQSLLIVVFLGSLMVVDPVSCAEHVAERDVRGKPSLNRPNVLLISIDTLRADRLGTYGHTRKTSPVLDRFARGANTYSAAFAPSPWTLPSHVGMLTGIHPLRLDIRHRDAKMPASAQPVSEYLRSVGYATVAFVDSAAYGFVGSDRGFGKGFDEYHHAPFEDNPKFKYDISVTVGTAEKWLAERSPDKPFFMFLHTKTVHATPVAWPCYDDLCLPYDQPAPFRLRFSPKGQADFAWVDETLGSGQEYLWSINKNLLGGQTRTESISEERVRELVDLYDSGIFFVDSFLGRLFKTLVDRGIWDQTLVIVTSDHGEAFLEHNLLMHQELYRETLHVPLIVKNPGQKVGKRIHSLVSLMDIVPTILSTVGVDTPPTLDGITLTSEDAVSRDSRTMFAYYIYPPNWDFEAIAAFNSKWKVVRHNFANRAAVEQEVYDVVTDRGELNPLASVPNEAQSLLRDLDTWAGENASGRSPLLDMPLDALEALRAIGYVD